MFLLFTERSKPSAKTSDRFWACVDKSGGPNACWLWKGHKNRGGYGQLEFKGKHFKAHRLAYEFEIGPIPEGMCVLHKCDNPSCCNPKHLFLGTPRDNAKDRNQKGRQAYGERHGRSKLTEHDVIKIKNDDSLIEIIASNYGVGKGTIYSIKAGRSWRHVFL